MWALCERERVQLLGGQVRIETAPGEGSGLMAQVPVELDRLGNHTGEGTTNLPSESALE